MPGTFRPLAALAALSAVLALATDSTAQKPFNDPILERMRKDVYFLASPECEGRGIDTKGIDKAADYIAEAYKKAGLKPAMKDGTYFQPFKVMMSAKLGKPTALTLTGPEDAKKELKLNSDFSAMGYSPTSQASGELVFAGYGISAPDLKYDDYAGLDVEGKVVVVLRRTPRYGVKGDKRFDTSIPEGEDSVHATFDKKIENAAKHKAKALIIVNDTTGAGKTDAIPPFELHSRGTTTAEFPVMFLKRAKFDELLKAAKQKSVTEIEDAINENLKPITFALKGWKAEAQVTVNRKEVNVKNVVGVLEGAGPLKDETIVIGAHYDHVGYGTFGSAGGPKAQGKIHYGADDNASGTTGLIELARRFGAMKNREGRRIVFIAFSAEEMGLFGSIHYTKEPLFPLEKTAAMINMDMIGRTKPVPVDWLGLFGKKDRLVIYGTGTGDSLEKLVNEQTDGADFRLFKIRASATNSDNHSFYIKKIPVLFFFTGLHGEYHRPTDVPEKLDVPGMKKVVDLAEKLTYELAKRETAPKFAAVKERAPLDPTDPRPEPKRGPGGPRLGILPDYNYEGTGLRLEGVSPGGVAEKAGFKEGDVIVEIAGKPVANITNYMTAMGGQKLGTTIDVVVERKGKKMTLKTKLAP